MVHDRCLKAVVSPCSSIAESLIKVRIPSVSVFAPFVRPEMSEFFYRDLYLRAAENTRLHSVMAASQVASVRDGGELAIELPIHGSAIVLEDHGSTT